MFRSAGRGPGVGAISTIDPIVASSPAATNRPQIDRGKFFPNFPLPAALFGISGKISGYTS